MNTAFSYQTSFILDKEYLGECFDESVTPLPATKAYAKAGILAVFGLLLLSFVGEQHFVGFFVVGLAVVEALSVFYKKTWWLWRQMIGRAYKSEITLSVDEEGITSTSVHSNTHILWTDVSQIEPTSRGVLVKHQGGNSYLSRQHLSDEAMSFIMSHQGD